VVRRDKAVVPHRMRESADSEHESIVRLRQILLQYASRRRAVLALGAMAASRRTRLTRHATATRRAPSPAWTLHAKIGLFYFVAYFVAALRFLNATDRVD